MAKTTQTHHKTTGVASRNTSRPGVAMPRPRVMLELPDTVS
jgi:hypothetical protein